MIIYLFSLLFLLLAIGLTLGPFFWVYIPEIVPPEVIPFSTCAYWLSSAIIFGLTRVLIGHVYFLFFFFSWSFLSLWINKKFVLETKGKTQE